MPGPEVGVTVLSPASPREELVESLLKVNGEARRTLRRDHLNRENERWAELHAFINLLLTFLEETSDEE